MKKIHWIVGIFVFCVLISAALSVCVSAEENTHIDHAQAVAVQTVEDLMHMESGKSYYLGADITVSQTVEIVGNVKLCLNGKILRYENGEANGTIFRVTDEGALEIFDCSSETRSYTVGTNGLWNLIDGNADEKKKELKGGVIIGGTGEKREIEEMENEYFCGGFAYVEGGSLSVYGGNIVGNQADYGGAVYVTGGGRLEIFGGYFCGNICDSRGGAVFVHSGTMLMNGGSVAENKSVKNGGGIDISGESIFEMRGGSVTGNTAGAWSGGIENFGSFNLYGGIISGNSATEDGGGIYNGGSFTMHGGTVSENSAKYGGGVCNDSKMTVHGGDILANYAQESGGGVYNADKLVINDGKIAGNTAGTSGGGIENDGICTMYGGSIGGEFTDDANMAYLGGGVCVYSGTFTMYGGIIQKNTGVDGGGIENEATLILQGGTVSYNFAAVQGGGITNRGNLRLEDGAKVVSNASGTGEGEYKGAGIYWIAGESTSVTVSGAVTVTGNTTNGEDANLVICGSGIVSASNLSEQIKIGFTLLGNSKKLASGTVVQFLGEDDIDADELLSLFCSDHKNYGLKYKNGRLVLSEQNATLMIVACIAVLVIIAVTIITIAFSPKKKRRYR